MVKRQSDFGLKLSFNLDRSFEKELHRRVDEYFRSSGKRSRDNPSMYLKTTIILFTFASTYMLLVFAAQNALQATVLSVLLGLSTAGIGFNIQHDGGHNAYSRHQWVNKIMASTMDLVGGSSYIWWWKHVRFHHRFVNITGYDTDIEIGGFGRMSPYQKHSPIHQWQHIYLWPLYGFIALKWQLFDDFKTFATERLAKVRIPRPEGWDLVTFFGGKIVFYSLAFIIPLIYHPWWNVLICYSIAAVVLGVLMSLIFQIPHCTAKADFPMPNKETGRMDKPWAVHQANTTLDFNRKSPIVSWLTGGLNCHLEHHLFPVVCHVHYPALTKIVEKTCKDFGIPYNEHISFWSGIVSHYQWLRQMGRSGQSKST